MRKRETAFFLLLALLAAARGARADDAPPGLRWGDPEGLLARVDAEIERRAAAAGLEATEREEAREATLLEDRWIARYFGERGRLEGFLAALGLDPGGREAMIRRQARIEVLLAKLAGRERAVPEDVLRERYRREFGEAGERLVFRHVFFATDPALSPLYPESEWRAEAARIEAEAEGRAAAALREIAAGRPFAEVAAARSDDPATRAAGGELDFAPEGRFGAEFDAALARLSPGAPPVLVHAPDGVHLVALADPRPACSYRAQRIFFAPHVGAGAIAAADQAARARAEEALALIRSGRRFEEVALRSDEEWARTSGGVFVCGEAPTATAEPAPRRDTPPALTAALDALLPGQVGGPVRTEAGYYIVRLIAREAVPGRERRRVRHILFATGYAAVKRRRLERALDERAERLARDVVARAERGEPLAAIARALSEDRGSRALGGEITPAALARFGDDLARAGRALEPGRVVALRGPLGWHAIVLEKRERLTFAEAREGLLAAERARPGDEQERRALREKIIRELKR